MIECLFTCSAAPLSLACPATITSECRALGKPFLGSSNIWAPPHAYVPSHWCLLQHDSTLTYACRALREPLLASSHIWAPTHACASSDVLSKLQHQLQSHHRHCMQGIEGALARSIIHLGSCATLGPFYSLFQDAALRAEFVNCGIDLTTAMAQVRLREGEGSGQLWSGWWRKGMFSGWKLFS